MHHTGHKMPVLPANYVMASERKEEEKEKEDRKGSAISITPGSANLAAFIVCSFQGQCRVNNAAGNG